MSKKTENECQIILRNKQVVAVVLGTKSFADNKKGKLRHEHFEKWRKELNYPLRVAAHQRQEYSDLFLWTVRAFPVVKEREQSDKG
jgi:hypothetical protein